MGIFVFFGALACPLPNQRAAAKATLPRAPWLALAFPLSCLPHWCWWLQEAMFMGRRVRSQQKLSWATVFLETEDHWKIELSDWKVRKQPRPNPSGHPTDSGVLRGHIMQRGWRGKWPSVGFSLLLAIPSQGCVCPSSRRWTESCPGEKNKAVITSVYLFSPCMLHRLETGGREQSGPEYPIQSSFRSSQDSSPAQGLGELAKGQKNLHWNPSSSLQLNGHAHIINFSKHWDLPLRGSYRWLHTSSCAWMS